jgi:uncharacterized protein YbjT (DUF2867 family)
MSKNPAKTIVVTGASGQQGGHLSRLLLARGHHVRALTRNPDGAAARTLASLGAELHVADLESGEGLDSALSGADGMFLVTTPFERGARAEIVQAEQAGRAAQRTGLRHLVYSSVTHAMTLTPVEHFAGKGEAERALASLDLPLTILGAPPFLDNVIASWHLPWLRQGIFAVPTAPFPMQMIAAIDIAGMAVHAFEHRDALVGQRVDMASDTLSGPQMVEILARALDRPLRHEAKTFAELDPMLGRLFASMDGGPPGDRPAARRANVPPPAGVDIRALHAAYPDVGWHSFAQWVAEQDWPSLLSNDASNGRSS